MKTISVKWLEDVEACHSQVDIFRCEWGEGEIEITRARLIRAAELGLDLDWLAKMVLTAPIDAKWRAERVQIDAKWDAERDPIDAKWDAERVQIDAKWDAERVQIDAKWNAERDTALVDALLLP